MRRRIYIDPEGDLGDHTDMAYLFDPEHDFPPEGQPFSICDTGALYDGDLWNRYQRACHTASVLRALICEKLIAEPYDEVELAARDAFRNEHDRKDDWDEEALERIRRDLRRHAEKKTQP